MKLTEEERIIDLLKTSKTIAVVGISTDPEKYAHKVPRYLKSKGYKIIPVNPYEDEVLGEKSFKTLKDIKETVDIIDIFRPGDEVYEIVRQAIHLKPRAIWMQEGVRNFKAKRLAEKNNIFVIMDRCIGKEHYRLFQSNVEEK